MALTKPQLVIGNVNANVSGGTLDAVSAITAITNPVDVSGSVVNIGNSADLVPLVPATDAIYLSDGTSLTVKFATGTTSAVATDNAVVAAVSGKKIRPLLWAIGSGAGCTATFKSDTGGGATVISETVILAANASIQSSYSPVGHFETVAGKALNLFLAVAVATTYRIVYVEV